MFEWLLQQILFKLNSWLNKIDPFKTVMAYNSIVSALGTPTIFYWKAFGWECHCRQTVVIGNQKYWQTIYTTYFGNW